MAKPVTKRFGEFLLKVGDGEDPEVFGSPCGLTEKAIKLSAETSDQTIPDCDDPDAAAWTAREVQRLSGEISGSGLLAVEAITTWREWFLSGDPRNVRAEISGAGAAGGGYYAGSFLLTSFEITGQLGEKVSVAVTAISDGEITWTAAA